MSVSIYMKGDYGNKQAGRAQKNKANQSQFRLRRHVYFGTTGQDALLENIVRQPRPNLDKPACQCEKHAR